VAAAGAADGNTGEATSAPKVEEKAAEGAA